MMELWVSLMLQHADMSSFSVCIPLAVVAYLCTNHKRKKEFSKMQIKQTIDSANSPYYSSYHVATSRVSKLSFPQQNFLMIDGNQWNLFGNHRHFEIPLTTIGV